MTTNNIYGPQTGNDGDESLAKLIALFWRERRFIAIVSIFVTMLAATYALFQEDIYRAETVIVPTGGRQSSPSMSSQIGSAAALVGINLGDSAGVIDPVSTAIAIMNSRDFILKFIDKHEILVPLFASKWNPNLRQSEIDERDYDEQSASWLLNGGEPTDLQAYRAFRSILTITPPDRTTGIARVAIDWPDPIRASIWANLLIEDINLSLKLRDVAEATSAIEFLQEQLNATKLVEMQRVFYQLIESQTRVIMLADVRDEYMFQVIDPAVPPDTIVGPNRLLISALGAAVGFLLALFFVLIRSIYLTRSRTTHSS
jgi:uncharacterized protein involved in exopolysaccharide biosynthesis